MTALIRVFRRDWAEGYRVIGCHAQGIRRSRVARGRAAGALGSCFLHPLLAAVLGWSHACGALQLDGESYFKLRTDARAQVAAGDYRHAFVSLQGLVRANSRDGFVWLELAQTARHLRNFDQAISAYLRALELGQGTPSQRAYDIACCEALDNKQDEALAWLRKS